MKNHTRSFDYPIAPVPFTGVTLSDGFWSPRLETNRTVTIPLVFRKCEETGRIRNFERAAGRLSGRFEGTYPFNDTDVYKGIEAASYSLARTPDRELDAYLDVVVEKVIAAQEADGYLYTNRTIDPAHPHPWAGPERWSNLVMSHELYNYGHFYDAAAAHYHATGKRTLLDAALKSAALVRSTFNPAGRHDIPGHQIIEMGLAKLYRITGDREWLETARFLLEERGRHGTRKPYMFEDNPGYCQDHEPVLEQKKAVGHAVRAVYMYSGMADVAALLPDGAYAEAIETIWKDVVESKIYLTGGIGARHKGEAFGEAYELPNATAYNETCAAIGSVMWNHRLFLLTGEAKYLDVLEQTLFNGLLSGVSLTGSEYFYVNPLESDGKFAFNNGAAFDYAATERQPWFDCSCCPTSLSRFFPSLPGYMYATNGIKAYVNLFATSRTSVNIGGVRFGIGQTTEYPRDGLVEIRVDPERRARMKLMVRIPGWARERVLGGSLYRFDRLSDEKPSLLLNGSPYDIVEEKGFAVLDREWQPGDRIELTLPMPVRKVLCDSRVQENRGKAALMRGPLVYCVEERDSRDPFDGLRLPDPSEFRVGMKADLPGEIPTLETAGFTAIPYFAWANRGPGPMKVWLGNGTGRSS